MRDSSIHSGPGGILHVRLPYRRNQDTVLIQPGRNDAPDVIAVVDGWNNPAEISSDLPGREAASFVALRFPELFLASPERTFDVQASRAAERLDREFLDRYPAHVASVGVFAFCSPDRTALVSVGTIHVWTWNGTAWLKPAEIGDCFLPQPEYRSGSRTFWGRGELKDDPFYALRADALLLSPETPFLMATDGLDDVLDLGEINRIQEACGATPRRFFEALVRRVLAGREQRDDITLLLRWKG